MVDTRVRERIDDIGNLLTKKQAVKYINKRSIKKGWEPKGAYLDVDGFNEMERRVTLFKIIEEKGKYSEKRLNDFLNEPFAEPTIMPYCKNKDSK